MRGRSIRLLAWPTLLLVACGPVLAQVVRQVTDKKVSDVSVPSMDDAGTLVYAATGADLFGTNPSHTPQIVRWNPLTGTAEAVTAFEGGVRGNYSFMVSVSDDGQWLAFTSAGDVTGGNHDQSNEIFVMRADGSELLQLTNDPGPAGGDAYWPVLSGSGNRVAFSSSANYLGTNPNHVPQIFVVNRDGTALRQLTNATKAAYLGGGAYWPSISDDGARLAFLSTENLAGTDPSPWYKVFRILSDGTGLRQLSPVGWNTYAPEISGNGLTVFFEQSNADVHRINWDGTGRIQFTCADNGSQCGGGSQYPHPTDDGENVFNAQHEGNASNAPNWEIMKSHLPPFHEDYITLVDDGNGSPPDCRLARGSGSGNRVAFWCDGGELYGGSNPDLGTELFAANGDGTGHRQLTQTFWGESLQPVITPDGSRIVFVSDANLTGGSPPRTTQVHRMEADGSGLFQVTQLSQGAAREPSVTDDGGTIVFSADSNPLGTNGDLSREVFLVQADGTGLRQLTSYPSPSTSRTSDDPVISGNGNVVVFHSTADLLGDGCQFCDRIFRVNPDGTGLAVLASGVSPRVDRSGTWVVYHWYVASKYQVFRIRTDGTGQQQLTSSPTGDSTHPDVSPDGNLVVYQSASDPLGTNPEANVEIFLYDATSATTRQLTLTPNGESVNPRITGNGQWVYFLSNAPFFEQDPDHPYQVYRVPAAGGMVERSSALQACSPFYENVAAPDEDGDRAVFSAEGDCTGSNPDQGAEVFLADRGVPAFIEVSAGLAPTTLQWPAMSGPIRYDAIRGDLANLQPGAGGGVDLGPVLCLENDSPDAHTAGYADPVTPLPGQAFFYVFRGSQGLLDGPGSYGQGTGGERLAGPGNCGS